MQVRPADPADAFNVAQIYDHYIATSHATFEIDAIGEVEMRRRIEDCLSRGYPFLVCEDGGELVGYAYGREFRPRYAYLHSIEVSVYIKPGHERKNIATALYTELLVQIKKGDFHTIIGGISLPNDASVALHEKFGFTQVAHFRQVGRKFGRWIDVGYWQLILDK